MAISRCTLPAADLRFLNQVILYQILPGCYVAGDLSPRAPVERMKTKPVVTTALAAALGGGLLLVFPSLWMFLVLALLALIAAQAALFARGVRVIEKPARGGLGLSPRRRVAISTNEPRPPLKNPSAVLSSDLFNRARRHIESLEQSGGARIPAAKHKAATAPPARSPAPRILKEGQPTGQPAEPGSAAPPPGHLSVDEVADRVAISAPGRRKTTPSAKSARAPEKTPPRTTSPQQSNAEEEVDWFDDLHPKQSAAGRATTELRQAAPAASVGEEAATLLRMAEEALRRGDLTGAQAGLGHYFSLLEATGQKPPWQAMRTKARLSVLAGNLTEVPQVFEDLLKAGFEPAEDAVSPLVDALLDGAPREAADPLRVSLLLKVLAVHRQKQDRPAMDRLYSQIIAAQERAGDERKAIQYLKNNLEIRRVMGQLDGQIELVDRIGEKLFRLGDTAAAREYYEMGMKLRDERTSAQGGAKTGGKAS